MRAARSAPDLQGCRPLSVAEVAAAAEAVFGVLTDHSPVGVFVCAADGSAIYANEKLTGLTGLASEETLVERWASGLHPDDAERLEAEWALASTLGRNFHAEYRRLRSEGGVSWVEASAAALRGADEQVLGWVGCCVDLTAHKLSDERYQDLFEHSTDALFLVSVEGQITATNRAGSTLTGYDRDELVGLSLVDLIAPGDSARAMEALQQRLAGVERESAEFQMISKSGTPVFVHVTCRLIVHDGRPIGLEAIARDTSERHELEERLRQETMHDPVTGLPNRLLFHDRLSQALSRSSRSGTKLAVMLLGLHGCELGSDGLGSASADELLVELTRRLQRELCGSDSVARLDGNVFGFLFEDVSRDQELVRVAERVLAAVAVAGTVGDARVQVTADLGITIVEPTDTAQNALDNAGTAMSKAKGIGGGHFEIYNHPVGSRLLRELTIAKALSNAIRDDQLDVHYQPIISLTDGSILGLEALVRWNDPQWGWLAPDEFIPIAEDHGLVVALGQRMLNEVARQATNWRADYPSALPLGIFANISPRQLAQSDFLTTHVRILEQHGTAPSDVGIEITEHVVIDRANETLAHNLDQLTQLGSRLSLDDFGMGYSSLGVLEQLPLTALKIDRSFVAAIRTSSDPAPISHATISLGHAFGLTVIAEGVETQTQSDYLTRLGCDAAQGFLYGRPEPADRTTALLQGEHRFPCHHGPREVTAPRSSSPSF
jgi:PAS domain S-box-containing protein/diguanylate cyclase (GGDEF)-like protein